MELMLIPATPPRLPICYYAQVQLRSLLRVTVDTELEPEMVATPD